MPAPIPTLPSGLLEALLESAERAGLGVLVANGSGHDWVSERAAALLDAGADELLTSPAASYLPADVEITAEPSVLEASPRGRDGAPRPLRIALTRIQTEEGERLVGLLTDRREQRRVERELLLAEDRFRQLVEVAPDAIVVMGRGRLLYANPAALRLVGVTDVAKLGDRPASDFVAAEDVPAVECALRALLEGRDSRALVHLRVRRPDGEVGDVEALGLATEWDGEPAVLSVGRDLAQRKAHQSREIQADRRSAVGTLSAGIAHEINNPLAYVLLNLEYLLREIPAANGDATRLSHLAERLEDARHGADRVYSILRDLNAFSAQHRERRGPVNIIKVLSDAIRIASPELEKRGRLVQELGAIPTVAANAGRLEQLFVNLLINATQALSPSSVKTNEVRVFTGVDPDGKVLVRISDTGAGIPPELTGRVFDPFFTTKPVGVGTGLGLPICHAIVRGLGGGISVDSVVGRGTTFSVTIPVATGPEKSPTPYPSQLRAVRRARVLIIDDEPVVATMLSRTLAEAHDVTVCTSGADALERLCADSTWDVVLCDLMMPDVSGMDLYSAVKERESGLERRIVFMTGGAFTRRAADFLASVVNERLEKPFDLGKLFRLVEKLAAR
jgi:PAS domain S-box-containing protein